MGAGARGIVSLMLLGAIACSDSEESPPGQASGSTCEPGDHRLCNSEPGCNGYQDCREDGSGFSECLCATDTPGPMGPVDASTAPPRRDATAGDAASIVPDAGDADAAPATVFDPCDTFETTPAAPSCGPLAASPEVLATDVGPSMVRLDATSAYWLSFESLGNGRLMSAPKAGGSPVELAPMPDAASDMVLDDRRMYWTVYNDANDRDAGVKAVLLTGGIPTDLSNFQSRADSIAVDGTHAYWANTGSLGADYLDGEIVRVPTDRGNVETLATDQAGIGDLAIDQDWVYWLTGITRPEDGTLMRARKDGTGTPEKLLDFPGGRGDRMVSDCSHLYMTAWEAWGFTGDLRRFQPGDSAPEVLVSVQRTGVLAIDSECVYWSDGDVLYRMPKSGGTPAPLATASDRFFDSLAVDDTGVYFIDYAALSVMRIAKD